MSRRSLAMTHTSEAGMPALVTGELGVATDTHHLFAGTPAGNVQIGGPAGGGGAGSGTVTLVSVVTVNGVSGTVATATTTPAISLSLGAITPASVAAVGTVTGSNLSGSNSGDQTNIPGNAATATALQTPRNINGVAFDGTSNITISAAPTAHHTSHETGGSDALTSLSAVVMTSGTLPAARLAGSYTGITGVGTLTAGVWNGTALTAAYVPALDALTAPGDSTTLDASTTTHGLLRKLDNNAAHYLDGTGAWSSPADAAYSADESTLHLGGTVFSVLAGGIGTAQLAAAAVTFPQTDASVYLAARAFGPRGQQAPFNLAPTSWGTVTSVSVATANGVSGSVATPTTTPALTLTLGAITPTSVAASGSVTGSNLSGSNTGDQTISLTGNVTGSGTGSFATAIAAGVVTNAMLAGAIAAGKLVGTDIATVGTLTAGATGAGFTVALGASTVTGTLPAANMPALTGDVTTTAGAVATTIGAAVVTFPKTDASVTLAARAFGPRESLLPFGVPPSVWGTVTSITLTGDVTGSGTGSFAATIAPAAVTLPKTDASVYLAARVFG